MVAFFWVMKFKRLGRVHQWWRICGVTRLHRIELTFMIYRITMYLRVRRYKSVAGSSCISLASCSIWKNLNILENLFCLIVLEKVRNSLASADELNLNTISECIPGWLLFKLVHIHGTCVILPSLSKLDLFFFRGICVRHIRHNWTARSSCSFKHIWYNMV